jgi:hypothetical protein
VDKFWTAPACNHATVIEVHADPDWNEILPLGEDSRALHPIAVTGTIDETAELFEIALALCDAPLVPLSGVVVADPTAFTGPLAPGGIPVAIEPPELVYRYHGAAQLRDLLERAWNGWLATVAAYPVEPEHLRSLPDELDLAGAHAIAAAAPFSVACGNDAQAVVVIARAWDDARVLALVAETVAETTTSR